MSKVRIGIFAGTFNPIHTGHITFALQALEHAKLDEVVLIPERKPVGKESAEHFGHRVAMIRQAVKPHSKLALAELVEARLTVSKTLPHLRVMFPDAQLVLLVGSDVLPKIPEWPDYSRLMKEVELVVGVRQGESAEAAQIRVESWPVKLIKLHVFDSFSPETSSSKVRNHLRSGQKKHGVLASVRKYSTKNWLYVRLPK